MTPARGQVCNWEFQSTGNTFVGGVLMVQKKRSRLGELLEKFSLLATQATGTSAAFILALSVIVVWGLTGPLFHFSDTWQLVINT